MFFFRPHGYLPGLREESKGTDKNEEEKEQTGTPSPHSSANDPDGDPDDGMIDQALEQADAAAALHSQYVTVQSKKVRPWEIVYFVEMPCGFPIRCISSTVQISAGR